MTDTATILTDTTDAPSVLVSPEVQQTIVTHELGSVAVKPEVTVGMVERMREVAEQRGNI